MNKLRKIHPHRRTAELVNHYRVFTAHTRSRFHYINSNWFRLTVGAALAVTGLKKLGCKNALSLQLTEKKIFFKNLPEAYNGFKILFLSDLHIEAVPALLELIPKLITDLEYDICILGGDYRYRACGNNDLMLQHMQGLLQFLAKRSPVYGVLGNHDEFSILEKFEDWGVEMLVNEYVEFSRNDAILQVVGVDDCHYYDSADISRAESGMTPEEFKIFICHSPELYREAEAAGYVLYLAGHTHGGQICLPGGSPVLANARIQRDMISGYWEFGNMQGYTCRGTGSGIIPVRFFCPPEIVRLELIKK